MREYNPILFIEGLNHAQNNANALWMIKNTVALDAVNNQYAALDAKRVASVVLDPADKSITNYGTNNENRQLTTVAKVDPEADSSSIAADDLKFALVDTTNLRVLAITDETTDQPITINNQVNLPSINWKIAQPTP